jgi:hypothetical protein
MRARRLYKKLYTSEGPAYAYWDKDGMPRRLWVVTEDSPTELYQCLEKIWRCVPREPRPVGVRVLRVYSNNKPMEKH